MQDRSAPCAEGDAYVLIVDDDADLCCVLEAALRRCGFAAARAANGREAIRSMTERQPAVVLLDLRMPVMDGWQLHAWMQEQMPAVPVVLMSAYLQHWFPTATPDADGYLRKPFGLDSLIDVVNCFASAQSALRCWRRSPLRRS